MARTVTYTIAYADGSQVFDLCKVLFGGDGSYYVTAPYHPQDRAIAAKLAVNYVDPSGLLKLDTAQELAIVDDDERRLKLSHHPDGFLQFSGEGITSGRDEGGNPRGIGTFSWDFLHPTLGPSWQAAFSDPERCGRPSAGRRRTVVMSEKDIAHMRGGAVRGSYDYWILHANRLA